MNSFEMLVMSWKDSFWRFGDVTRRAGLKERQLKYSEEAGSAEDSPKYQG
jgi:hypothetical protein